MLLLYLILLFAFGLAIGSFLNVVVYRLGTYESVMRGRSHCDHCLKILRWHELIPLVSFTVQRGLCRSCREKIPASYSLVELATALLFLLIGFNIAGGRLTLPFLTSPGLPQHNFSDFLVPVTAFIYYLIFVAIAVAVSSYDLKHRLIPRMLIWPLALVGLLAQGVYTWVSRDFQSFGLVIGTAAAAYLFFWAIWFFSKGRAMGRGDADVAMATALYLGPMLAVTGIIFAFWVGAIFGVLAVIFGKLGWKSEIAFAPFLFLGAFIALAFPSSLLFFF